MKESKVEILADAAADATSTGRRFLDDLLNIKKVVESLSEDEWREVKEARAEIGNPLRTAGDIWELLLEDIKEIVE